MGDSSVNSRVKKNKFPTKMETPLKSKVSTESDVAEKDKSTKFANISHKNNSGANNWKIFIESNPSQVSSRLSMRESGFKSPMHSKVSEPTHKPKSTNTSNKFINTNNKYEPSCKQSRSQPESNSEYTTPRPLKSVSRKDEYLCETKLSQDKYNNIKEKSLTKQIAMDCEMVGVEIGAKHDMLARISLVNAFGNCIYDKYVKPTEPVLDYRTRFSGIRPENLEDATDFKIVQKEVADIINGRVLVGHALKNDLKVLYFSHPKHAIRDTSKFYKFRKGKAPALKNLAKTYLGVTIQDGEHSSVQDALAAMQLYRMFRKEWEVSIRKKTKNLNRQINQNLKNNSVPPVSKKLY